MPSSELTAVVAIASSAGGLSPLREFFESLPREETGAAFVVLQHLTPDQPTRTPEILSGHTSLPVALAEDGSRIRPDRVVVLPSAASLRVEGGTLRLERSEDPRSVPSVIDTFLESLAEDLEERAIGVLLSGSGSDGTVGMKAVRQHGGVTMAQDPDTAEFEGMPWSAIRAGAVDYVATVPKLAAHLVELLSRRERLPASRPGELPETLIERAKRILERHTGHRFAHYKDGTVTRRLWRRLQLHGVENPEEYLERLEGDPEEADALFRDLLIGVTRFFRDPDSWESLAESVVPKLFAGRGRGDEVRVWVPGCSTGEDAYTTAILLEEHTFALDAPPEVKIFATDIDDRSLSFGREGLYSEGIVEQVSAERLERFFTRENDHYRVAENLRERCVFAPHNLLQDPPFSRLDLLVCRNLLIYLQPEAQESAARVFQYGLAERGYLFLGSSENLAAHEDLFDTVDRSHRIYRRNEQAGATPVGLLDPHARPRRAPAGVEGETLPAARPGSSRSRRAVERNLMEDYGPGAVLVNEEREVLEFFGRTRKYLQPSAAHGGSNVIEMALPGLRGPLRSAMREAMRSGREVTRRSLEPRSGEDGEVVDVSVWPVRGLGRDAGLFLAVFRSRPVSAEGEEPVQREGSEPVVRELEEELRDTREHLQATIEELESSNEELQSANEELLSMNEELQTSKEETQSVNEELSNNIEQLDEAHSDLENLFRSTQIAIIFLDRENRIQRFTPATKELFRLRDSDIGRSLEDITHRFVDGDIEEDIDRVLETLRPREREVRTPESGRWYTLRISPYRTVDDVIEGVVVTFSDITKIKESEERLRQEREFAESFVEAIHEPLVVLDADLRVLSASRSFLETFGLTEAEVTGARFLELHEDGWGLSRPALARVAASGEVLEDVEAALDTARDQYRIMRISAHPAFEETDGESGDRVVLVIMQDITDLREREREKEAEIQRKDWFLTMVGHELRNPLAPVQHGLELIRREALGEEDREDVLEMMGREVRHLKLLVDDLLDLSRIRDGELQLDRQRVDIVRIAREAAEDFRHQLEDTNRSLVLELPEGPEFVDGDDLRLHQALVNLFTNARQHTGHGDRVTMSLRRDPQRRRVSVTIADTGEGLTARARLRLFEPFHRDSEDAAGREPGLGVGLTLVRGLVEAHGGAVEAESEGPGRGTAVTIHLPLAEEAERAGPDDGKGPERRRAPDRPLRILIVEDQPATAATSRLLLEVEGHEVATASDGESGLQALRDSSPDVVLCDLSLPGSMNGYDLAEAVRSDRATSEVRLVAVTGWGHDAGRERAMQAGFDAFLVKPVSGDDLMAALARVTEG